MPLNIGNDHFSATISVAGSTGEVAARPQRPAVSGLDRRPNQDIGDFSCGGEGKSLDDHGRNVLRLKQPSGHILASLQFEKGCL